MLTEQAAEGARLPITKGVVVMGRVIVKALARLRQKRNAASNSWS